MKLTKSKFRQYLTCPREFWLAHQVPELFISEDTPHYQHLREQGYEFQKQARKLDVLSTPNVQYEREFTTDRFYAKADAVITDPTTGALSIYEIKSSASVKEDHLYDTAFQKAVAEAAGEPIASINIVHVNTQYTRNGEVDAGQLCTVVNVTAEVDAVMPDVLNLMEAAHATFSGPSPEVSITAYCDSKLDCTFIRHHFSDLPDYTIFNIPRLAAKKIEELLAANIVDIRHIPADFKLSDRQRAQVNAAQSKETLIDREAIAERLSVLEYPLCFLDYETFGFAVPQFSGVRPYQQMPFQYSLHMIDSPGAAERHEWHISTAEDEPARQMAESLHDSLGGNIGTVIVWSQGFESKVNREVAEMYPEYADFFTAINEKTFDLRKIFSDLLYIHPDFRGRDSIKMVMPVLTDLSYDSLEIQEGMSASINWYRWSQGRFQNAEKDAVYKGLQDYCHLDTLAMVRIFEVLRSL